MGNQRFGYSLRDWRFLFRRFDRAGMSVMVIAPFGMVELGFGAIDFLSERTWDGLRISWGRVSAPRMMACGWRRTFDAREFIMTEYTEA